jgi:hypothetical protein
MTRRLCIVCGVAPGGYREVVRCKKCQEKKIWPAPAPKATLPLDKR